MNRSLKEFQGPIKTVTHHLSSLAGIPLSPLRSTSTRTQRETLTRNISQIEQRTATAPSHRAPSPLLPSPAHAPTIHVPQQPQPHIAYELVQGSLVRYSSQESTAQRQPPTAVLIHGILGSRRNMQSFARRIVEGFPSWQVLLVDLRCHGDSATLTKSSSLPGPHDVNSAAGDVLRLLSSLKLFPEMLIGHSFGGKVVMSMAHQFGRNIKRLPRPVRVWVLDALPGEVRSGEMGAKDRPADLITTLQATPLPLRTRSDLMTRLEGAGFSSPVASWAALNLAPMDPHKRDAGLGWSIDIDGIAAMYRSYEETDLWPLLMQPAEGIHLSFVRAERSSFRWGGSDQERIISLGHAVHLLKNSGHWVHSDNPDGLFDILGPSFGTPPDIHMQRSPRTP